MPARQRIFLETLAATGVVRAACEAVELSPRSAYNLRIRADGAAFRLGWDAAILIARARLADDLLARAIEGQQDVITRDEENGEIVRTTASPCRCSHGWTAWPTRRQRARMPPSPASRRRISRPIST